MSIEYDFEDPQEQQRSHVEAMEKQVKEAEAWANRQAV